MGGIGGQGLLFLSSHINNDSATRTRTRTGPMIRLWEDGTSVCQLASRQINGGSVLMSREKDKNNSQHTCSTSFQYLSNMIVI